MTNKKFKIAAMSMALTACVAAQPLMANAADTDEMKESVSNATEPGASEDSAVAGAPKAETPATEGQNAEGCENGFKGEETGEKKAEVKAPVNEEADEKDQAPAFGTGTKSDDITIDYKPVDKKDDTAEEPGETDKTDDTELPGNSHLKGDVIDESKKNENPDEPGKIGTAEKKETIESSSSVTEVDKDAEVKKGDSVIGKDDDGNTTITTPTETTGTNTTTSTGTGTADSKTEDTKTEETAKGDNISLDDELREDKSKLTWDTEKGAKLGGYTVNDIKESDDKNSKELTLKKTDTIPDKELPGKEMSAEDIAKLLDVTGPGAKLKKEEVKNEDGTTKTTYTLTKTETSEDENGNTVTRVTHYEVTGSSVRTTIETTLVIKMEKKENTSKEDFSGSDYPYPSSSTVKGDNGKDYNFVLKDVLKNATPKDGKLVWEDTENNLTYTITKKENSENLSTLSNEKLAELLNNTTGKDNYSYSPVDDKLYYKTETGEVCEVTNADNKLLRESLKYTITITDHQGSKSDTKVDGSDKTVDQAKEEAKKNAKEEALKKAFAGAVKQETGKDITDIDLSKIDGDKWTWTDSETGKTYTFTFTYKENESGTHDTTITRENVTDVTENTESGTTTVTGSTVIWTESGKTYTDETISSTFGGGYSFTEADEAKLKEKFDVKDVVYDEETGKLKSFTTEDGKTYTFTYKSVSAPDGLGNVTDGSSFMNVTWNITKKETKPETSTVTGEDKHFEIERKYTKETAEDGSLTIRDKDGKVLYENLKKVDGKDNVYTNADNSVTITINKTTLSKDDVKKEIEGRINGVTDVKVNENGTFSYKIGDVTYTGTYDSTVETLDVITKTVIEGSSTTISASSTDNEKAKAELREKLEKLQTEMGEDEELVVNGKHFGKHTDVEIIIKSFKTAINYKNLSDEELVALLKKQKADADKAGNSYTGEGVIHNDKNQPGYGPGKQPDHSIGSNPNFIGHLDLATDSDLLLEDGTTMDAILLNDDKNKFTFEWNLSADDLVNKNIKDNQAKFKDTISYDDGKQNGGDGSKGHYEYERGNGRNSGTWIDNDNDNYPHQSAFYRLTGTIAYGSLENGKEYASKKDAQDALNNWRAAHGKDENYKPNIVKMTVKDERGRTKTVYKAYRYESSLTAYGYMSKDSNTCVNSRYSGNKWAGGYDLRISGLTQVSKTEVTAHGKNYYDYSADISRVKKNPGSLANTLLNVKPTSKTEMKDVDTSDGNGSGVFGSYGVNKREEHDYTSEDCNYNVVESTGSDSYITYREWQDASTKKEGTLEKIAGFFGFKYRTTKGATSEAVSKTTTTTTEAHVDYNFTTVETKKVPVYGEETVIIPPEETGDDDDGGSDVVVIVTPDDGEEAEADDVTPAPEETPEQVILPAEAVQQSAAEGAHALPQTGVNWLAAIAMAVSGFALMAAGAFASLTGKNAKH